MKLVIEAMFAIGAAKTTVSDGLSTWMEAIGEGRLPIELEIVRVLAVEPVLAKIGVPANDSGFTKV